MPFNNEELQTLIRSWTHAVILNLTKTIEKPKGETYNLESLIEHVCQDENLGLFLSRNQETSDFNFTCYPLSLDVTI